MNRYNPRAQPAAADASSGRAPECPFWRRLRGDQQGAIMVIAVFMAACLVGAIWYMYGLGEAMIYRQHLRMAADATAFDDAVVHALGMNMLSMMNVAMAAVLSTLVALEIIFLIGLVVTIIALALLAIPGLDLIDATTIPPLVSFDQKMYDVVNKWQPVVFRTLELMNTSEGFVGMLMPWAGFVASTQAASAYGGAVTSTHALSVSMIPTRVPFTNFKFMNRYNSFMTGKYAFFTKKLPLVSKLDPFFMSSAKLEATPGKIPLFQRYGLPVQDDTYGMLCMHAGLELGLELDAILTLQTTPSPIAKSFSAIFGQVIGTAPWLFCQGVAPLTILKNWLGEVDPWAAKFLGVITPKIPVLDTLKGAADAGGKGTKDKNGNPIAGTEQFTMFPMKPYDESGNGNMFMQIWASVGGSATLTAGAATGVAIAGWGSAASPSNQGGDDQDFAEAEFYFNCGDPGDSADVTVWSPRGSGGDGSGHWQDCKYNALWNMDWKARLRRYHQAEWDIRKFFLLSVWNGAGLDGFMKGLSPLFKEGSLTKTNLSDPAKACFTAIGSGSTSGVGDFGGCPVGWLGTAFTLPNGGKVPIGSGSPDGFAMSEVLH
jgi:hypothetical protein